MVLTLLAAWGCQVHIAAAENKAASGTATTTTAPTPTRANTANTVTAELVAQRVQTFYDQIKDLSASFAQTYYSKIYQRYDRSKGTVLFKKPGKMRWDYQAPNGKIVIANGKQFLVYEPGEQKGEPGQVFEQPLQQADLPQALSFLIGQGKLANDFQLKLLDANASGFRGGHVLELTPNKPSPQYERVVLYVDASESRLGFVHRVVVLDSTGNRNRFDFTSIRFNRGVSDAPFSWRPPKGTRQVHVAPATTAASASDSKR